MNRRAFVLASTASFCAVPLIGSAYGPALPVSPGQAPLDAYRILYDRRFAASRRFGADIARRGGWALAIDGDVTALWFDELAPRWARGEGVVAGMTTGRTLLCLERLAWDQRLRVTMRVAHVPDMDKDGRIDGTANALVTWVIGT